nr:MAG TPA: hypothetical protein [Caudoviricetes sp.]
MYIFIFCMYVYFAVQIFKFFFCFACALNIVVRKRFVSFYFNIVDFRNIC